MRRLRRCLLGILAVAGLAALMLLAPLQACEQPWHEEVDRESMRKLSELSGRVSRAQFEEALAIIDPADLLRPYLRTGDNSIGLRSKADSDEDLIEVQFADEAQPLGLERRGWQGLRIVLDPGHFGGEWSEVESRHVQLDEREPIREGSLTWATARLLADRLRAVGAEPILTRGPPQTDSFPSNLDPAFDPDREAAMLLSERLLQPPALRWWRTYPSLLSTWMLDRQRQEIAASELFPLYNHHDLRRRARVAPKHDADLTISLHYNSAGRRPDNWLILFVYGNLLPGEVDTPSQRYYAVRRALDGTLPRSIDLGRKIMGAMQSHLRVDFADYVEHPDAAWPKKRAIAAHRGVYARNLAVLRRTPGPVLLVEGPAVNFAAEYERLQKRTVDVDGTAYSPRVEAYAEAVFEGLARWLDAL